MPFWMSGMLGTFISFSVSLSRLVRSVFLCISSCRAKVCVVLEFPKWGQITASKRSSPRMWMMTQTLHNLTSQVESSSQVRHHFPKLSDAIIRIIEQPKPVLCLTLVLHVPLQRAAGDGARQRDSGRLQAVRVEPEFCLQGQVHRYCFR